MTSGSPTSCRREYHLRAAKGAIDVRRRWTLGVCLEQGGNAETGRQRSFNLGEGWRLRQLGEHVTEVGVGFESVRLRSSPSSRSMFPLERLLEAAGFPGCVKRETTVSIFEAAVSPLALKDLAILTD